MAASERHLCSGIDDGLFNVGTGVDVTIRELAETVMSVVGFRGEIVFDANKPDGTPRKLLNVDRLSALGWTATTTLRDGIARAYADFLERYGTQAPAPPEIASSTARDSMVSMEKGHA